MNTCKRAKKTEIAKLDDPKTTIHKFFETYKENGPQTIQEVSVDDTKVTQKEDTILFKEYETLLENRNDLLNSAPPMILQNDLLNSAPPIAEPYLNFNYFPFMQENNNWVNCDISVMNNKMYTMQPVVNDTQYEPDLSENNFMSYLSPQNVYSASDI